MKALCKSYFLLVLLICFSGTLLAKNITVYADQNLQSILNSASDGDVIILSKGVYLGNFVINKQVRLTSKTDAVIDAQGKGHALELKNSHITINNLIIKNWGDDLTEQNSAIYSNKKLIMSGFQV